VPFPWREERNPFHALVAEILLARTRAQQVLPVFLEVRRRYPTAVAMLRAGVADIRRVIRPLGLAWRAAVLYELAGHLARSRTRVIPRTMDGLRELPGVGGYVSASFLSFHCGVRAGIVDSNVVRLYSRLYGITAGPESHKSRAFADLAEVVTPRRSFRAFNYAVLDFTRDTCTPRAPRCVACPLRAECPYARTTGARR
jgi:A/G-specific adenine glycosylase